MRSLVWDRPRIARKYRDRFRSRGFVALESRDLDEETELAFHKVWLARELETLPAPHRRPVRLPRDAASGVLRSIDGLRSACGINPLPRRLPH